MCLVVRWVSVKASEHEWGWVCMRCLKCRRQERNDAHKVRQQQRQGGDEVAMVRRTLRGVQALDVTFALVPDHHPRGVREIWQQVRPG